MSFGTNDSQPHLVFDTSALVQVLASPRRVVLLKALLPHFVICTSQFILDETEYVLRLKFKKTKAKSKAITRAYQRICLVSSPSDSGLKSRDPSDNPIVDLCLSVRASILVTDDKDLLEMKIRGCKIMNLGEFMKLNK